MCGSQQYWAHFSKQQFLSMKHLNAGHSDFDMIDLQKRNLNNIDRFNVRSILSETVFYLDFGIWHWNWSQNVRYLIYGWLRIVAGRSHPKMFVYLLLFFCTMGFRSRPKMSWVFPVRTTWLRILTCWPASMELTVLDHSPYSHCGGHNNADRNDRVKHDQKPNDFRHQILVYRLKIGMLPSWEVWTWK